MPAELIDTLRRRLTRPRRLGAKDPAHVRVMTYNTHHGANRAGEWNIEAIAETIEDAQPDVVALQEVDRNWGDRSGRLDQPAWYAERLGMHVHYVPNLVVEPTAAGAHAAEYGLAVLSRWPLSAPGHRLYEGDYAEPRGLVASLVSVGGSEAPDGGGRTLRIINTHLSVRSSAARASEIHQLLSYADSEADLPTVVAGDFNALTRAKALSAMRASYGDAWDVGLGFPATLPSPLGLPGRRIDYLWTNRRLRAVRTSVIRSRASDHYALVSDLAWGDDAG